MKNLIHFIDRVWPCIISDQPTMIWLCLLIIINSLNPVPTYHPNVSPYPIFQFHLTWVSPSSLQKKQPLEHDEGQQSSQNACTDTSKKLPWSFQEVFGLLETSRNLPSARLIVPNPRFTTRFVPCLMPGCARRLTGPYCAPWTISPSRSSTQPTISGASIRLDSHPKHKMGVLPYMLAAQDLAMQTKYMDGGHSCIVTKKIRTWRNVWLCDWMIVWVCECVNA